MKKNRVTRQCVRGEGIREKFPEGNGAGRWGGGQTGIMVTSYVIIGWKFPNREEQVQRSWWDSRFSVCLRTARKLELREAVREAREVGMGYG